MKRDKCTYLQNRKRLTDLENELLVAGGVGKAWGEGTVKEFGMDTDTLLYLKWITSKDLLYGTGNSAQCYVAAWMGGKFWGEWIHVDAWLGIFPAHLELSQHC